MSFRKSSPTRSQGLGAIGLGVIRTDPADADRQTRDTIAQMATIVPRAVNSPIIRSATSIALLDAKGADPLSRAEAIYNWIKRRITFKSDEETCEEILKNENRNPTGEELLIEPDLLLTMRTPAGDCDDFSMLALAMLKIAGVKCRLVTIAADPDSPGVFTHVYVEVYGGNGSWLGFDASHGKVFGWAYNNISRKKTWEV